MKTYLGDSVYCEITDDQIILTTENGFGASNTIYIDANVYIALMRVCYNYPYMAEAMQRLAKQYKEMED